MKLFKKFIFAVIASLLILSTTACDGKKPEPNYLNEDEILELVSTFTGEEVPSYYSFKSNLNYFAIQELPKTTAVDDLLFVPYPLKGSSENNEYLKDCASFYIGVPLQITKDNWNQNDDKWSTRYQIESRLYRTIGSLDKVYYYKTAEGGLAIKAFAVNKELLISNAPLWEAGNGGDDLVELTCSGKWNITIEYNSKGLLVKEEFETINRNDPDTQNCYGKTIYEFVE